MEVLTRAFYARHDTRTPVVIGTIAMGLNVAFSISFSRLFAQMGWMPHGGLALANSLATALEASALFIVMRRALGGMNSRQLLRAAGASVGAGVGMGAALVLWLKLTSNLDHGMVALGGVAVGGSVYTLGVWLLRVREIKLLSDVLRQRLRGT